jgi:carboxypeptidase PM20D1
VKKVLIFVVAVIIGLFISLIIVSETKHSRQIEPIEKVVIPDILSGFEDRLSAAVQIRTISYEDVQLNDTVAFIAFHQFLHNHFPLVHERMHLIKINRFGLLYVLEGSNPDLRPAMFLAHQDVVPIPDSSVWKHPPFSGHNDGAFIWGRGTIDDKGSLLSILEAAELFLQNNGQPQRSLILAFGFDEEINGEFGAKAISGYLEEEGIRPEFILDEGLVLTHGVVPMIEKQVGLIGIAEKGYLTLRLVTEMDGGHSSMPDEENSLSVLAAAITKLNENSFDAHWCEPVMLFMDYLGPEMDFFPRLAFNNRWFFSPIIKQVYLSFAEGRASLRTTTAPTIFRSGVKDNVIPQTSEALVNFRILPGETIENVVVQVKKIINDDRVAIFIYGQPFAPPAPSPISGIGFETIMQSITAQYENAIAVPYLTLGGSDAKHYYNICDNIYRFAPYEMTGEDMSMIHGANEKISIANYRRMIEFYYRMIYMVCN